MSQPISVFNVFLDLCKHKYTKSLPTRCFVNVGNVPKAIFIQYLIAHFGIMLMNEVIRAREPILLPIVTYGIQWICTFSILY